MKPPKHIVNLSDKDLIKEIVKNNSPLLFEILYDRYALLVYNKCLGFAKDEDEAKDLTQDVFLKLFVKLSSFKGNSKFSTWLYTFTYNYCVNHVTRDTAKKFEKKLVDFRGIENLSDGENDYGFLDMKVDRLRIALEFISPEEKMILILKYQDLLSIRDIEQVLGIGESAVKMRLKRAKEKLIAIYTNDLE